jgi:predicted transcriptional regulator
MQSATERRQALLELLCERRHEKIDNLVFEFNVSRSTVKRDVQILSISYPVYTSTGNEKKGGGVHVVEGYYIGRKYLKPNQQALLEQLSSTLRFLCS